MAERYPAAWMDGYEAIVFVNLALFHRIVYLDSFPYTGIGKRVIMYVFSKADVRVFHNSGMTCFFIWQHMGFNVIGAIESIVVIRSDATYGNQCRKRYVHRRLGDSATRHINKKGLITF